jgi:hypothetical protein
MRETIDNHTETQAAHARTNHLSDGRSELLQNLLLLPLLPRGCGRRVFPRTQLTKLDVRTSAHGTCLWWFACCAQQRLDGICLHNFLF